MPSHAFPASYAEARASFLRDAALRTRVIESATHPRVVGAEGEPLAIDFALLGEREAPALLIVLSGTHGVEGFCGSACQVALLRDDAFVDDVRAGGTAVLLVHAVNPYGFSHLRRANEDNVDLNRNFRDFSQPRPDNAAYAELHSMLVPDTWPPTAGNTAALMGIVARHGMRAFQAIVSGGQNAFSDGLFYGGSEPAWSNGAVRDALARHGAQRSRIAWLDLHTGLGPPGGVERIWAGHDDAADVTRARTWWGADVTSFHDASSSSAALSGAMYTAVYDACPAAEFTGITLECGTRPLQEIFHALRAEQWLHNHPSAPASARASIKRALRDAFHVESPEWQDAALRHAREAALAGVRGLAAGALATRS